MTYDNAITLSLILSFIILFRHQNYCTAMASELSVKRILVTGANKGIGKGTFVNISLTNKVRLCLHSCTRIKRNVLLKI
jgi:hypothetical protein